MAIKDKKIRRKRQHDKKAQLLGMNHSTASNRLRKMVLFSLVQQTNQDICYRCGEKINKTSDLSIEHKEAWMSAENPKEAHFNLENITFSHLKCNIGAAKKYKKN